jgi:hypothetical protein
MQSDSKINNDIQKNNSVNYNIIANEELLLKNREIINNLVLENLHRKDKSFLTIKELEIMRDYESNLLRLMENCPPLLVKSLMYEIEKEHN